VSRYESFKRQPSVPTTFAYEIIFNEPIRDLFAGYYESVRRDIRGRAARLLKTLGTTPPDHRTSRKLNLLRGIVESAAQLPERHSR
jgi:hypothetical protein